MRFILLLLFTSLFFSTSARADVDVTFYSHDFGDSFPHAFFTMKGTLNDGQEIDTSYGFTAVKVSPAILWKSVTGAVQTPKDKYIGKSNPHFKVTINDEDYAKLMIVVKKWEDKEQKSYSLKKRNCVHFASEAIAALGYQFNAKTKYWRKPKSFMLEVLELNPTLIAIDYKKVKEEIKAANKEKEQEDKTSQNEDKASTDEDEISTDIEASDAVHNETDVSQPSSDVIK